MLARKKILFVISGIVIALCVVKHIAAKDNEAKPEQPGDYLVPTKESIQQFEKRVQRNKNDFRSAIMLSRLYMRQARETDNFDSFISAEKTLRTSLKHSPDALQVRSFLAETLMAQHQFAEAKKIAESVLSQNPEAIMSLATIGDANMQLGEYIEAENAYKRLLKLRRSPAATVRLARLCEIQGETNKAIELATQALSDQKKRHSLKSSEAWYHWRLGKLLAENRRPDLARKHFETALELSPSDSESLAALAKLQFFAGETQAAIDNLQHAIKVAEKPPFLISLGDIQSSLGNQSDAEAAYSRAKDLMAEEAEHPQAGPAHARERAMFLLNHDADLELALKLAKSDFHLRSDIFCYDLLAWAYYKNNHLDEAKEAIDKALAVNSQSIPQILFHAGMIEAGLGNNKSASSRLKAALKINPNFSILDAAVAKSKLTELTESNHD